MINSNELFRELSGTVKVVAFMEIKPLSDKFQQIALTQAQAKKVRDAIYQAIVPGADLSKGGTFDVTTNDDVEIVLPNIRDYYDAKFFEEDPQEA